MDNEIGRKERGVLARVSNLFFFFFGLLLSFSHTVPRPHHIVCSIRVLSGVQSTDGCTAYSRTTYLLQTHTSHSLSCCSSVGQGTVRPNVITKARSQPTEDAQPEHGSLFQNREICPHVAACAFNGILWHLFPTHLGDLLRSRNATPFYTSNLPILPSFLPSILPSFYPSNHPSQGYPSVPAKNQAPIHPLHSNRPRI